LRETRVLLTRKKKAPAVGTINATIEAGLEITCLVLHGQEFKPTKLEKITTLYIYKCYWFCYILALFIIVF
jgi:hypothetical protein